MYVLFIEDEIPDQTELQGRAERFFPHQQPKLKDVYAPSASKALERLGLDTKLAGMQVDPNYNQLHPLITAELMSRQVPKQLRGMCCDLKISSDGQSPATPDVGANLVRLFFHWRNTQKANFSIVVYTSFHGWRNKLVGFCDAFYDK